MLPDLQVMSEIVRASLPSGAALDPSLSIGAAGLDSLRLARIVVALEEFLQADLLDSEVERLLASRDVGTLLTGMDALARARAA